MNQDPPTVCHLLLSCNVFEYNSTKVLYFHLKCCGLFLYSKCSSSLITESKMFHITAP